MKKHMTVASMALFVLVLCACVPLKGPAPTPQGPPPVVIGDSVAYFAGQQLPGAENDAVGGSTVRDTASNLPAASSVLVHVGGHSWAEYDADQAWSYLMQIVNHYRNVPVYVATTDLPGAIYCGDGNVAAATLGASGIAYGPNLLANPDYELRQRLEDFNARKLGASWPSNVHVVDWRGLQHYGPPDCIHFTDFGAAQAANAARAAGFAG